MRLGLVAVAVLAVSACTRQNPGFGVINSEGSTKGSGPEPDTTSDGADVTSVGSSTESGDCMSSAWELEPIADTFVMRSADATCSGLLCQDVNFGSAPTGPIEDLGPGFQSYLLMSFDLSSVPVPQTSITATLEVSVVNGMPIVVQALEVFPTAWNEGNGLGHTMAGEEQATWKWSANPTPWTTPTNMGSFETVLLTALEVGSVNGAADMPDPHPLFIALDDPTVAGWLEGDDIIHLAITVIDSAGEAGAFTTESDQPPVLRFEGC